MWEDYKKLTHKGKKSFFATTEAPEAVKLQSFVQLETSFKAQIAAKQKQVEKVVQEVSVPSGINFGISDCDLGASP
jgi:hypothetical protein